MGREKLIPQTFAFVADFVDLLFVNDVACDVLPSN